MPAVQKYKLPKCFAKDYDGIFVADASFFDEIKTRNDALMISLLVLDEIHSTLKKEAILKKPLFIGKTKLITGLNNCLTELDRRWPCLEIERCCIQRRVGNHVLQTC